LIGAIVGGVALGLLLAWWIIARITGPLNQMRTPSRQSRKRRFHPAHLRQHEDEVGQTANPSMNSWRLQRLSAWLSTAWPRSRMRHKPFCRIRQVATSSSSRARRPPRWRPRRGNDCQHQSRFPTVRAKRGDFRKSGKLSTRREVIHKAAAEMTKSPKPCATPPSIEELASSRTNILHRPSHQGRRRPDHLLASTRRSRPPGRRTGPGLQWWRRGAQTGGSHYKATEEITQMIAAMQHSAHAQSHHGNGGRSGQRRRGAGKPGRLGASSRSRMEQTSSRGQ